MKRFKHDVVGLFAVGILFGGCATVRVPKLDVVQMFRMCGEERLLTLTDSGARACTDTSVAIFGPRSLGIIPKDSPVRGRQLSWRKSAPGHRLQSESTLPVHRKQIGVGWTEHRQPPLSFRSEHMVRLIGHVQAPTVIRHRTISSVAHPDSVVAMSREVCDFRVESSNHSAVARALHPVCRSAVPLATYRRCRRNTRTE